MWDALSAYADGAATSAEAARVERHVAQCDSCARDLRFLRETASVLASAPEIAPPPGLRDAILASTVYRPTWAQRARHAGLGLVAGRGAGTFALAGSAAAILLVGYVAFTRARVPDIRTGTRVPGPRQIAIVPPEYHPGAANVVNPGQSERSQVRHGTVGSAKPPTHAEQQLDPLLDDGSIVPASRNSAPVPHIANAAIRRQVPFASGRPYEARARDRVALVGSGRSANLDLAPAQAPEKDDMPADMIVTTDMKMPMDGMGDMGPMTHPMGNGSAAAADSTMPPRTHIALAAVTSPGANAGAAPFTLADLRRQLRHQAEPTWEDHPEFHLRSRHELLSIMKSSF